MKEIAAYKALLVAVAGQAEQNLRKVPDHYSGVLVMLFLFAHENELLKAIAPGRYYDEKYMQKLLISPSIQQGVAQLSANSATGTDFDTV